MTHTVQVDQSLLNAFEACGPDAFGPNTGWGAALSSSLMHDLGRYREYRCARLHMVPAKPI